MKILIRGAGNCESLILRVIFLCLKYGGIHCICIPNFNVPVHLAVGLLFRTNLHTYFQFYIQAVLVFTAGYVPEICNVKRNDVKRGLPVYSFGYS